MKRALVLVIAAACSRPSSRPAREQRVIAALAEDNYVWARRDPDLVAKKLAKMQRGPYEWLRGTAGVFWRDVTDPETPRAATAFGSPASSRVLLVGDPHPENLGTFRAGDGTLVVDWNDFDAAGYGPFEGDARRLAAGMIIATGADSDLAAELARQVGRGYATEIALFVEHQSSGAVTFGAEPYLDKLLGKARENGDARATLEEVAPPVDGVRQIAFGDLEPVADDGVIEDRLEPVGAEAAVWIDDAIARWRPAIARDVGPIELRARRIGSGVSSYAVLRYVVVLGGPSAALDDDVLVELKEERDGLVIHDVPHLEAAEWTSPARRVVDAQRRMQARPDSDVLLGAADLSPLAFKLREATAYQRGISASDLAERSRDEQLSLAFRFGGMLARAHGQSLTADGVPGWTVLAPLLPDGEAFATQLANFATSDASQIVDDWSSLRDADLATLVVPQ